MVMMNNLKKITALFLLAAFLGLPIQLNQLPLMIICNKLKRKREKI